ncbi:MAG: tetratricopeptide repeat protein [Pseudomonadota bacterium]
MRKFLSRLAVLAAAGASLSMPGLAAADINEIGKQLHELKASASQLATDLNTIQALNTGSTDPERRLVEGQVAFGTGNYPAASIIFFDIVSRHSSNTSSYREALFLLAESLFQKGDLLSAREYYRKIVIDLGEQSPHYQDALQRLLELSLQLQATRSEVTEEVKDYVQRLDRVPQTSRLESAPYVRGKYEFFKKNYLGAISVFETIPRDSEFYLRARYLIGASHVGRKESEKAISVFESLTKETPTRKEDERVVQEAHLALGRIFYEQDQNEQAIDQYLMIRRDSEMFDTAMGEVAWVYVKAKQFDKALRSLELLALANPDSAAAPGVRILQGNLSIHRAQILSATGEGNSREFYANAKSIFERTREEYQQPGEDLKEIVASKPDASKLFAALAGKSAGILGEGATIPDMAVRWASDNEEVARAIALVDELNALRSEIEGADTLLARLGRAVNSSASVTMFPDLAERRIRAQEILESTLALRQQLAAGSSKFIGKVANPAERSELEALSKRREDLSRELATMPNAGDSLTERIRKARAGVLAVDQQAQEAEMVIGSLEAEIRALDHFQGKSESHNKMPAVLYENRMKMLKSEVNALRLELAAVRQETAAAMDVAGVDDADVSRSKQLRSELDETIRAEQAYGNRLSAKLSGSDQTKLAQVTDLIRRTNEIEQTIAQVNSRITAILDTRLGDVRLALTEERSRVDALKKQLAECDAESTSTGAAVAVSAFERVAKVFYQIAIRAELGTVDVAWSIMEDAKEAANRVNLESSKSKRVLIEDFKDIDGVEKDSPMMPPPPRATSVVNGVVHDAVHGSVIKGQEGIYASL